MQKLFHITDNFYPDKGGGPSHVLNIVRNLKYEHVVLTRRKNFLPATEKVQNCNIFRFSHLHFFNSSPLSNLKWLSFPFRLLSSFHYLRSKFSFISKSDYYMLHFHGVSIDSNFYSLNNFFKKKLFEKFIRFSNLKGRKVLTLHTCQPKYNSDVVTNGIYNHFIKEFDTIICVDIHIFEYCKKFSKTFKLQKNIFYLPNSIDTDFFIPKDNYNSNEIVLGFSGRFTDTTDFNIISKLIHSIPDGFKIRLAISTLDTNLNLIKKSLAGNSKVEFFTDLSPNEMVDFYNQCDLLFNPIKHDAISLVTLEAMSCGKPVIMFSNKYRNFLEKEDLGFLIETKVSDLLNLLNDIKENREVVKNKGQNSREYILKHHSNEIILSRLEKIYNKTKDNN